MITLRPATTADGEAIWQIFREVIAPGDAFVFTPDTPRSEALAYWFRSENHAYVAEHDGQVVGSYIVKPNQPGLGAHIANAAYMVSPSARGLGVGKRMGEHSLVEARRLGFNAMQFNIVVSTNEPAVRLWQRLGFRIVGTLPGAFKHAKRGLVDAYIMFRTLDDVL